MADSPLKAHYKPEVGDLPAISTVPLADAAQIQTPSDSTLGIITP